jgi:hypothetical protein
MMKLIDDWRRAWKFLSVWIAALAGTALELYEQVPQFKAYISDNVFHHLMTALVVCIIIGRLVKQSPANVANPVPPTAP